MRTLGLAWALALVLSPGLASAQSFAGTFTANADGANHTLVLQQSGSSVTGTLAVGPMKLAISATVADGKAKGTASMEGAPIKFSITLSREAGKLVVELMEQDNGTPDPATAEKIVFTQEGGAPADGAGNPLAPTKPAGSSGNPLASSADPLTGTFRSKDLTIVVKGSNGAYSGALTKDGQSYPFTAQKDGPGMSGTFEAGGGKYEFLAKVEDGTFQLKTGDTVYMLLREGPAPAGSGGAPSASSNPLDRAALSSLAQKVKSNLKRDKASKVLAEGNPPLTVGSVAAFAELLRRSFEIELTETEYEQTAHHFMTYYQKGDDGTKAMIAGGWQRIVAQLDQATPEQKAEGIRQVKEVLQRSFAAGAQKGMEWAIAMNQAIERRAKTLATISGDKPAYAAKAGFHTQMTEADLDAAMEMLYFMWVACGRNASLVTPQAVATVRALVVQGFPTFPAQVQYIFANAQKVYASVRGEWAQATQAHRLQMARTFSATLDQLGLTVPAARGDTISASGAWSDMNGKSHSAWAADMVQGLAGSTYVNAWNTP